MWNTHTPSPFEVTSSTSTAVFAERPEGIASVACRGIHGIARSRSTGCPGLPYELASAWPLVRRSNVSRRLHRVSARRPQPPDMCQGSTEQDDSDAAFGTDRMRIDRYGDALPSHCLCLFGGVESPRLRGAATLSRGPLHGSPGHLQGGPAVPAGSHNDAVTGRQGAFGVLRPAADGGMSVRTF